MKTSFISTMLFLSVLLIISTSISISQKKHQHIQIQSILQKNQVHYIQTPEVLSFIQTASFDESEKSVQPLPNLIEKTAGESRFKPMFLDYKNDGSNEANIPEPDVLPHEIEVVDLTNPNAKEDQPPVEEPVATEGVQDLPQRDVDPTKQEGQVQPAQPVIVVHADKIDDQKLQDIVAQKEDDHPVAEGSELEPSELTPPVVEKHTAGDVQHDPAVLDHNDSYANGTAVQNPPNQDGGASPTDVVPKPLNDNPINFDDDENDDSGSDHPQPSDFNSEEDYEEYMNAKQQGANVNQGVDVPNLEASAFRFAQKKQSFLSKSK